MDTYDIALRLRAGIACGRDNQNGIKTIYLSESSAERVASSLSKIFGEELDVYPCVLCGNWHIGKCVNTEKLEKLAMQFDYMV